MQGCRAWRGWGAGWGGLLLPPGAQALSQGELVSLAKSSGSSETQCPQLYGGKITTSPIGHLRLYVRKSVTSVP